MTPFSHSVLNFVMNSGSLSANGASFNSSQYGIRPVISLKKGVKYTVGTGSPEDPYIVNTESLME